MQEISGWVREGSQAYIRRQTMAVSIFFAVVFSILLGLASKGYFSFFVPFGFLSGGFFSWLSGFIGLSIATRASHRTAAAAKLSLNQGLQMAFSSGAVMGLSVVGLGLLLVSVGYFLLQHSYRHLEEFERLREITSTLLTFGMGASSLALFARVGGGIFTKAADVGADLVGKVEAGIPEDDPRNPAVIADNVGDNVGDVAGMGADLYESYVGSIVATMALGVAAFGKFGLSLQGVAIPMVIAAIGILASIVGTFFVRTGEKVEQSVLLAALRRGVFTSAGLIAVASFFVIKHQLGTNHLGIYWALLSGLLGGIFVGLSSEYFTSGGYKPTQDVAKTVAKITGIHVEDISTDERKRLMDLEKRLHERIVGQDEAVKAVSSAIRRARAGLKDPGRPVGSFIFLGPTGVGKTELAKALAEALYADENSMVRLDMSEYSERHTVSRMIGSPPGYVGYEDAGQLTEAVRRKPFSVVLFDEIEKAHPEVFNILLQILEDGRLTDAHGRTVDFKNTVLIMTSNVGTGMISAKAVGFGEGVKRKDYEDLKEELLGDLQKNFRPEFLNRIDEIIVFHPLNEKHVRKIADILIERSRKLLQSQGIALDVTKRARNFLAERGFDPELGARPLKRLIQKEVENPISNGIVSGDYKKGDTVGFDFTGGKPAFKLKKHVTVKV